MKKYTPDHLSGTVSLFLMGMGCKYEYGSNKKHNIKAQNNKYIESYAGKF